MENLNSKDDLKNKPRIKEIIKQIEDFQYCKCYRISGFAFDSGSYDCCGGYRRHYNYINGGEGNCDEIDFKTCGKADPYLELIDSGEESPNLLDINLFGFYLDRSSNVKSVEGYPVVCMEDDNRDVEFNVIIKSISSKENYAIGETLYADLNRTPCYIIVNEYGTFLKKRLKNARKRE